MAERKAVRLCLAVVLLPLAVSAGAEVISITGQIPARFSEPSQLRRLTITPFEGQGSQQVTSAVEAELATAGPSGTPYFTIVSGGGGRRRIGSEGTLGGSTSANVAQNSYQREESRCVEGGFFNCRRSAMVTVSCTRRQVQLIVNVRIVRATDRRVVYSATKPYQDEATWCDGQSPNNTAEGIIAAMAHAAAQSIVQDISPHLETYEVRLEEGTQGLGKSAIKPFRAAVKISTHDFTAACAQWEQLRAAGESGPSLLFDLGVCAEKAGDIARASTLYAAAQALVPEAKKSIADATARTRLLLSAQQSVAAQRTGREQGEAQERRAEAAAVRAQQAQESAARRQAAQRTAAAAAAHDRERQDVARRYGADAADAIVSHTVRKGMTPAQVRAALGTPGRVQRIDAGEEQWFYPGRRIVFLNGRVTYVG